MGIVHHAAYLTYFEAGRVEYMRRRSVLYSEWVRQGVHLPVVEVKLRYRRPSRFDEILLVDSTIGRLTAYSARFDFRIWRAEAGTEVLVVEGYTLLGCIDDKGALQRIPEDMARYFTCPETASRPVDQV